MFRKPRPKNEPILTRWMFIRYIVTGFYVGLASIFSFINYFDRQSISLSELMNWSNCNDGAKSAMIQQATSLSCDLFHGHNRIKAQSIVLSVLVTIEMLKALSAVSLNRSFLSVPPWKNKWLILGVIIPYSLQFILMYVPFLGKIFGVAPLSRSEWVV